MDTAITLDLILKVLGIIVAFVAGISAIAVVIKWINAMHDKQQKIEEYDNSITEIKEEQCMLTYCMLAVLEGLKQQGCNGPVTEARDKLEKHINKKAHDIK